MNRFVKSKAPSFLKVFERNDEKDDRRLLEMSTNSFGSVSLPATTNEKPHSDDNNDAAGGSNGSNRQEGEHTGPCEDPDEDQGLPKNPLNTEEAAIPVEKQTSREIKVKQARTSSSAKVSSNEGEQAGSKLATQNVGINGLVRSQSDRRLARNEGLARSHSERSLGSEPSAFNAPPKPSFDKSSPYPASPPHRLSEVPVSIVKHAEACFSSPVKARKGSLFGRLRPRKDEANNPQEQVEVAVAEVDGGADSLPFAQLTLEAIGNKPEKATMATAVEALNNEADHEVPVPAKTGAETSKNLKHLNREGGRGHEGRRPSSRELVRKKSGERLNNARSRPTDPGRNSSRGAKDEKPRRKSRNEEAMKTNRRRRSESMPRRRSVSRTKSGKPDSKQTRIEATGPLTKSERSPGSPNRSSTPTRRKASQVGETLEWRRNPRSASKGPPHSNSSPSHRSKPEQMDNENQERLSRHEVSTTDLLEKVVNPDRDEQVKRPSPKRQTQASQSLSDDSSCSLHEESAHSTRGLLGTFLDQKRTFSEHVLPKGDSEGSQNSRGVEDEFAGDFHVREGAREGRTREISAGGTTMRKKPLLQFPLDSEHTLFSAADPNATPTHSSLKTDTAGQGEIDADGAKSGRMQHQMKTKGIFESSILQHAPEASESGESEPDLSRTASRKHLARRSSRRRSSTTAVDVTQTQAPKRLPRRATATGIAPPSTGRVRKFLALPRSEQKTSGSVPLLPGGDDEDPGPKQRLAPSAILEVRRDSDTSDSSGSDDNMTSPSADVSRDVPAPVSYTFSEIPFLTISKDIVEMAERSSSSKLYFSNPETNESQEEDVKGPSKVPVDAPSPQEVFIVGRKNGIHDDRTSDEYSQLSFELAQSRIRLRETRMEVDQIELDILMLQERLLVLDQRKEANNVSLFV